jgi:hypothetical protein
MSKITGASRSERSNAEDIGKTDSTVRSACECYSYGQTVSSDEENKTATETPEPRLLVHFILDLEVDWTLARSHLPEDWMWDVEY